MEMLHNVPKAHILIHAGDFTMRGHFKEIENFNKYLDSLTQIEHKVVIAGNNETSFDSKLDQAKVNAAKSLLTSCIYLQDNFVCLYGLKIYGSPW